MHAGRCLLLLLAAAMPAAHAAEPLDLTLPRESAFARTYRNAPPGTWYGDKSLPAADGASVRTSACPKAADGSDRPVTGSVTTGFGYTSGYGSSRYNGADVNYCKEHVGEDGDSSVFNVQIHVDKYDGPGRDRRDDALPWSGGDRAGPRDR